MKKFIFSLIMAFVTVFTVNAQSIEFHQSYVSDNDNSPYAATRVIASYFYTSKNEKMNLFTWNAFDKNATNTLLYTEHKIGKSNFYVHPEIRFDYWHGLGEGNAYDFKPQLGVSYLIPWEKGPAIYLTPKIMTTYCNKTDDGAGTVKGWSNPDLQFSINTSYENDKVYYEGYIDTNWFGHTVDAKETVGIFTEQKAYYKMTNNFQIGGSVVFAAGKLAPNTEGAYIQPYISFRVAM